MKKNVPERPVAAGGSERKAASSPISAMTVPTQLVPAALLDLAEEFGRLVARELARPDHRRGYSLPELVLSAAVAALFWVLIALTFGLISH